MPRLAVNTGEMQIPKTVFCGEICTIVPALTSTANVSFGLSFRPDLEPFTSEKGPDSMVNLEIEI